MAADWVLVTGASTGLGLAIARQLIAADRRVILTARAQSLGRFAEQGVVETEQIKLRPLDVTHPDQRRAVVREAEAMGGLGALVNNAGISYRAVAEHVAEADRLRQMDVNFRSPMNLTRCALPGMRSRRAGRILNISSVGGMMAMPTMAVYSASKFALEGACEALWYEVRPWGIHVSLVEPGFINSNGFEKVRHTDAGLACLADPDAPYHQHYANMAGFIGQVMKRVPATPETVARKVVRVLDARRPALRVPATLDAWAFSWMRRVLPRQLYHRLLYASLPNVRQWGPR